MPKRFTESDKWRDRWFRRLSPENKLAWQYVLDCCDQAGVFELDEDLASFSIGCEVAWESFFKECGERVRHIRGNTWFLTRFVKFQYGKLSESCKPHAVVFEKLRKHGIDPSEVDQSANFKFGSVSEKRRKQVFDRDGNECCYCGRSFESDQLELDHVTPRSKGGNDSVNNLVVACAPCNNDKSDLDLIDFLETKCLDKEGTIKRIEDRIEGYLGSLQEKEKEKDKDKDKEKNKNETATLSDATDAPNGKATRATYPAAFEEFWLAYPANDKGRKRGKRATCALWRKVPVDDRADLLKAAQNYAKEQLDFIRDPERFLKQDWWRDWIEPATSQAPVKRKKTREERVSVALGWLKRSMPDQTWRDWDDDKCLAEFEKAHA